MQITRRSMFGMIGGTGLVAALPPGTLSKTLTTQAELDIRSASFSFIEGTTTEGLVSTHPGAPPPVIRMRKNVPFNVRVTNKLDDYTTMHWHGLRLANAMDGVPYLTQIPLGQGDSYDYELVSPDAGTFWYHPHCMTMDQMALGLTGILIVEEDSDPGFDAELPLNLRDFRLDGKGAWIDLWTARGAARGGTLGTFMTTNWTIEPTYHAPAGGLVRLRVAATDPTRVYKLYLPEADAKIIALDGHPLPTLVDMPTRTENALVLGPGQRADIAVLVPKGDGKRVTLFTDAPGPPRILAHLVSRGQSLHRSIADVSLLPPNPVKEPNLAEARREEFVFGWSPEGDFPNNGVCGSLPYTFWSINRTPWAGDAAQGVGPLATFNLNDSVVLRLRNESPNDHPIHLHGLAFRPIRSNKRELPPYWTDTVLLQREETVDIAFVADNPGDWAFHCHVIEHQKTGLAGFVRVLDG
ncbi:MAG: multicopper oxidase family protein [Rhodobacteraceae bacterium]|nr:multicopper oxidase family protein [Paracoccaceae bacterium]